MGEIPHASIGDSLRFNRTVVIPTALQGALLRRQDWVDRVGRFRGDLLSPEFGDKLRRRYGKGVYIRFVKDEVLLLLEPSEIQKVLEGSPTPFGHTTTKKEKMGHFEPEAVTISPPETYAVRRAFNEAALCPGRLHALATTLHAIVRQEARSALSTAVLVGWQDLSKLFERITLRVIFGRVGERELRCRTLLAELMSEANGARVPERGDNFDEFRRELEAACTAAGDGSLAAFARSLEPGLDPAVVPDQVTHWLFAMNDTLAENATRAAALISGVDGLRDGVSKELDGVDLDDPAAVRGLTYLVGCLQEAMRLWPTTNFLMRTTDRETTLCGAQVPTGTTVLMVNEINHLDPGNIHGTAPATHCDPDRWRLGAGPYHHFGGGGQRCPGEDLALLIATGVLASLHEQGPYRTVSPDLSTVDQMPQHFDPFKIELQRG